MAEEDLLHTKRYALFWVSSLLSNIGTWMQQVAQPWIILSVSHSSFWVGFDSFAMNAPGFIFVLWGGFIADRFNRKHIVLVCQSIQFFCVLALLLVLLLGKVQIWMILLCSFLVGTTDSLSMPAFQSIIPSLVKEKDISRAISLNATQFNLSRILGPAFAGIMIASYGAAVCYGANLVSYIPFFLSLYWIYPKNGMEKHIDPSLAQPKIKQVFQILSEPRFLRPLLNVLATTMFCSPLVTFSAVMVKNIFHGGADDLGYTMTAFGVGGVAGALIPSVFGATYMERKYFSQITAAILGLAMVFIAEIKTLFLLDLLLVFAGALLIFSNTAANANLQKSAHNQIRGRVISLFQLALHGGIAVGSLWTGITSSSVGVTNALLLNGCLTLLSQAGIFLYFRKQH